MDIMDHTLVRLSRFSLPVLHLSTVFYSPAAELTFSPYHRFLQGVPSMLPMATHKFTSLFERSVLLLNIEQFVYNNSVELTYT